MCYTSITMIRIYFNPRSHKGSDSYASSSRFLIVISIHAPTRGATPAPRRWGKERSYFNPRSHKGSDGESLLRAVPITISIHAPTRGATKRILAGYSQGKFQSTLPQGERRDITDLFLSPFIISIHAPTRGATKTNRLCYGRSNDFNPRSHKGSDLARFYKLTEF